ncbi:MaoC family dehydratase N-terminal domain-containing protein [Sphaerisporangium corydalis]|uniref:MaoC family dehydratase N-terminal domain-containing protein n=1 Tax=Sphaerisporangium corydalis TaxID=1441875 RepID=A0ABV9EC17_9ACTN|nr:MaoC family dehydratase N-terminal domain-containing protein [Sphaerisporangium corydalis]
MAIDTAAVGTRSPDLTVEVGRGRLRLFARATGEHDPVYTDPAAARAEGHRDLPVPPTFLFCLEMDRDDPWAYLTGLGIDPRRILHGEQRFTYHAMAYAGDRLTLAAHISDVYTKKGGALDFLVRTVEVTRADGPVATLTTVLVVPGSRDAP